MELPGEGLTVWICRANDEQDTIEGLTVPQTECFHDQKDGCAIMEDGKPCDARKAVIRWVE